MSVRDLLEEVRLAGASIYLDGTRLRISDAAALSEDLVAKVRSVSSEIADYLRGIEILPPAPSDIFANNFLKSLRRHSEILDLPINPEDRHTSWLVAQTATAVINTAARTGAEALKAKQDASRVASPRLIERVTEARRILAERRSRRD
jgi:hypothetical protein